MWRSGRPGVQTAAESGLAAVVRPIHNGRPINETKQNVGRMMRFIASAGWADQDPDVVAGLLETARDMATLVLADEGTSAEVRAVAQDFLDRLRSDTL
jgi:hypothetical protein